MKELLIIRHAKSSWSDSVIDDFDRPLNERGNSDAPRMAKLLFEKGIHIDALISSTANRAFSTATYFAKEFGFKKINIRSFDKLYHAPAHVFYDVIEDLDNHLNCIAIFAHNPGITDFVNSLSETKIDNMPTCGIFAVKVSIKNWDEFRDAEKNFWFFESPKMQ
ncbi:MAG: histidine phosphatase family protein [Bacteroidota bacterium]